MYHFGLRHIHSESTELLVVQFFKQIILSCDFKKTQAYSILQSQDRCEYWTEIMQGKDQSQNIKYLVYYKKCALNYLTLCINMECCCCCFRYIWLCLVATPTFLSKIKTCLHSKNYFLIKWFKVTNFQFF